MALHQRSRFSLTTSFRPLIIIAASTHMSVILILILSSVHKSLSKLHFSRSGKCVIDETEKGWYVTWVVKDQDTLDREAALNKKNKLAMDYDERQREYIAAQIEKAKEQSTLDEDDFEATELLKGEDEQLKLDMKFKSLTKVQDAAKVEVKNVFKKPTSFNSSKSEKDKSKTDDTSKRKSALEEIMEQEKKKKKVEDEKFSKERSWVCPKIVVKIVTKSLGDKYYKKKGYIKEVIDDFAALVVMNDTGAKVKLDQDHLETVVPQEGREVVILWGVHQGQTAILKSIDTDNFRATLKLSDGDKVKLPYEQFSKKYAPS